MFVRFWNRLRSEGPRATARAIAQRARKLAYLREEHVWYGCDLTRGTAPAELHEGLRLVRADASRVDSVVAVGQDLEEARERFDVTAPGARGKGIATAAWILVGEELKRAGYTTLVAKIETANTASKRVAEKAGFHPVAVMQHERTGVRRNTAVRALGGGLGDELAARLS